MKVMQVMPEFGMAGAEVMCENLMYGLKEQGISVFAVSLFDYHSAITDRIEAHGIKIYYLNKKRGFDLSVYRRLYSIVKAERPDVVHTHRYVMEYAIPIAIISNIKTRIHTVHNIASKEQEKSKRVLARLFFRHNNVIPVALSNEIKKTIISEYHLKEERIPIVLNGEDLSRFNPKKDYRLSEPLQIYHIGRFLPVKNQELIIDCAKQMKADGYKINFHLVGDSSKDMGIMLKEKVKKLGLYDTVVFDGVISNIPEMLQRADLFILPSLYEGVPMTLIEAMATGLPIISTNVGGIPDMLVDGVSALLMNDPKMLYQRIVKLVDDDVFRERIGRNAYLASKAFTYTEMAVKYLEIYNNTNL